MIELPTQLLALGVIVYVTVPPFADVSSCCITDPVPEEAPDTLEGEAVQSKVVPLTEFGFVIEIIVLFCVNK